MNDPNAIDSEDEMKTRVAAAEARRIPKQNSNDEGRTRDLQIEVSETSDQRCNLQAQPCGN